MTKVRFKIAPTTEAKIAYAPATPKIEKMVYYNYKLVDQTNPFHSYFIYSLLSSLLASGSFGALF